MGHGLSHTLLVLFFLQLGVILLCSRLLGELMKRLRQPPVLGELLAGLLLGPSLLGWAAPSVSAVLFPANGNWLPALDTVSWFGLVLLMLLTGLETDVRLLRSLGKPAFMASLFGLVVPFASGLVLGYFAPDHFIPEGTSRLTMTLFFATALSISAMPVIAKILMDLKLVKRNVGVVTLTAAVVDDTIGWIALAVIAGLAAGKEFHAIQLARTLGYLAAFLLVARYVLHPVTQWTLRFVDRASAMPGAEYVVVTVLAFLCAAATEGMGVHAVFGAFVAGTILRQCAALSGESVRRLEGLIMAIFAPLFFAVVGLKVDFGTVQGHFWPLLVIGVAIGAKVIGCLAGGLLGRLSFIESLTLGLGMSARGAMGLVVAVVGANLGVISPELFAIIVLMAMATSFFAPLSMRPLVRFLPVTEEERKREEVRVPGFIPRGNMRALIPASGGANARIACHLAANLCSEEGDEARALYIETQHGWLREPLFFWRRKRRLDVEAYLASLVEAAKGAGGRFTTQKMYAAGSVRETILAEVGRGRNFLFLGASGQSHPVYDPFVSDLVRSNPCHVVVVRGIAGRELAFPMKKILVPTDGSYLADAAFQLAATYAGQAKAEVVLFHVMTGQEGNPLLPLSGGERVDPYMIETMADSLRAQFAEKIRPELLQCRVVEGRSLASALAREVAENHYDLAVLGAENKSIVERVYLGRSVETILDQLPCPVAIVIPKMTAR